MYVNQAPGGTTGLRHPNATKSPPLPQLVADLSQLNSDKSSRAEINETYGAHAQVSFSLYPSALEMCSRQGAIQIHVYLTLLQGPLATN